MSKYITAGFDQLSNWIAAALGQPAAFLIACATVLVWGITGPFFGYSDTWQLVINTGTTIVTFLMVFLIQNSQNHDSTAVQLKLDELIRALNGAKNSLIDLENATEDEIQAQAEELRRLAGRAEDAAESAEDAVEAAEDSTAHLNDASTPRPETPRR